MPRRGGNRAAGLRCQLFGVQIFPLRMRSPPVCRVTRTLEGRNLFAALGADQHGFLGRADGAEQHVAVR